MIRLLTLAALLAAAAPAVAQTADQDIRCMIASNAILGVEKDPTKRALAQASSFFYLGRIDQRVSPAQLKAGLLKAGQGLNGQNLGPLMTTCVRQLQQKQQVIQQIGREIIASQPKK